LDSKFCKLNSKKNSEIQWGEFERPLWVRRWAYLRLRQQWTTPWNGQPAEVNVWSTRQ